MNGPAGRNSKAIMVPSYAGRPVAVFNGVRRGGGPVHGAEEISPLRVSVLRIAVRQAHTSNALIPRRPALSRALVWGWASDAGVPDTGARWVLRSGTGMERRKRAAWPLSISRSPDAPC